MESFTSTRGKITETEQLNASEKSEKQPVDKYGGRVRSITKDGDIQTTEAFVRQVVDRIQGVIEAKLTPTQPSPILVLSAVYPDLNYQSSPFYPTPYPTVSPPQVGYGVVNAPAISYQVSNAPQVGYNILSAPQKSNVIPRNISKVATNNTPISAKIYNEKRRCWICSDEKHFASNCPNNALKDNDITQNKITEPNISSVMDQLLMTNDSLMAPTLRMVDFENVDTNGTSKCVYLSAIVNDKNVLCMCDAGSDVN